MFIKEDSFVYWIENDLIEDEKAADILKSSKDRKRG
jgi:hypothetical protein